MSQSAWPTEVQVGAVFTSQGLTAPSDLDVHINAAISAFELATGWRPFLESSTEIYTFDPPANFQRVLDLKTGFTEILAVEIGVSYTRGGTVLTEGQDYDLLPLNARTMNRPITSIRFKGTPGSSEASIEVTGKKGFDTVIPDDCWLAVRDYSMALAILEITNGLSTASEITQGPVRIKFDNEEGRSKIDRWKETFKCVATRYKRIVS